MSGRPGQEENDLSKILSVYRAWHLDHFPKYEYYHFVNKLTKIGKEKETQDFLKRLRNHYKGDELIEEF